MLLRVLEAAAHTMLNLTFLTNFLKHIKAMKEHAGQCSLLTIKEMMS